MEFILADGSLPLGILDKVLIAITIGIISGFPFDIGMFGWLKKCVVYTLIVIFVTFVVMSVVELNTGKIPIFLIPMVSLCGVIGNIVIRQFMIGDLMDLGDSRWDEPIEDRPIVFPIVIITFLAVSTLALALLQST